MRWKPKTRLKNTDNFNVVGWFERMEVSEYEAKQTFHVKLEFKTFFSHRSH